MKKRWGGVLAPPLVSWLLYQYRRLRGTCLHCGGPRNIHERVVALSGGPVESVASCFHCTAVPGWCHWCGKERRHGTNYSLTSIEGFPR